MLSPIQEDQYRVTFEKYSLEELRGVNTILQDVLYGKYQKQDAHYEMVRVIDNASSLDEFITMWKGNKFVDFYQEDELKAFWQEFQDGRDNSK